MTVESQDQRRIPILTDAVEKNGRGYVFYDTKAVHAALVTETLNLADTLLHQATKEIEATLFERVFDRLRAQLPELVDHVLRAHSAKSQRKPGN